MTIGMDQTGGLSERAATSITSYINRLPSGANYLERLTAAGKTFNVPVTVNGELAVSRWNGDVAGDGNGFAVSACEHDGSGLGDGSGLREWRGGIRDGERRDDVAGGDVLGEWHGGQRGHGSDGQRNDAELCGQRRDGGGDRDVQRESDGERAAAGGGAVVGDVADSGDGRWRAAGAGTVGAGNFERWKLLYFRERRGAAEGGDERDEFLLSESVAGRCERRWERTTERLRRPACLRDIRGRSTYERTGLGWDATDGLFVVKNENAGSGTSQRGLGFWIGSNVRWMIDTGARLSPFRTIPLILESFRRFRRWCRGRFMLGLRSIL